MQSFFCSVRRIEFMKLLHVIGSIDPMTGGTYHVVKTYGTELIGLGIYSEVVCLDDPGEKFLIQDSFIIHALGPDIRPWAYSAKLLPWLTENLPRFDIVIVHGLWLYHSHAVWKAVRQLKDEAVNNSTGIRFFIMPHGMLDPWFQDATGSPVKSHSELALLESY